MKVYYGVEFQPDADAKVILADYEYCDSDGSILITNCCEQAIFLKNQFICKNIYEEMHELIQLHPTEIYGSFTDYGMISKSGNHYLFKEMVCVFQLKSTAYTQEKMCILQMEEHLLAVSGQTLYASSSDSELLQKIAHSYEVAVNFDLDKKNENV